MNAAAFRLVLVLALVTAIVVAVDRAEGVVPRGSRLEALVQRWSAALQAVVVVAGLLAAVDILYGTDPAVGRWLTVGVFVAAAWSSRRALSDWASGIMLRSEGTLGPGSRIGFGDERGRIRRLGLRSVEVEAENGRILRLPYSGLAESDIEVGIDDEAGRSHTFTVDVARVVDAGDLSDRMAAAALLSPWSSSSPPPHVRVLDRGADGMRFEVTVYPVDPAFVARVEEAVRAAATRDGA